MKSSRQHHNDKGPNHNSGGSTRSDSRSNDSSPMKISHDIVSHFLRDSTPKQQSNTDRNKERSEERQSVICKSLLQ